MATATLLPAADGTLSGSTVTDALSATPVYPALQYTDAEDAAVPRDSNALNIGIFAVPGTLRQYECLFSDLSGIPAAATITQLDITFYAAAFTRLSGAGTLTSIYAFDTATNYASNKNATATNTSASADRTLQITGLTATKTDLANLRAKVTMQFTAGSGTATGSVDAIKIVATYTAPAATAVPPASLSLGVKLGL